MHSGQEAFEEAKNNFIKSLYRPMGPVELQVALSNLKPFPEVKDFQNPFAISAFELYFSPNNQPKGDSDVRNNPQSR